MTALIAHWWPALVAALVIGLIVAWYLFHATRRTRVSGAARDVLDEGAAPAARNAALIDAAPAAAASPAAAAPSAGDGSELALIKGIGPKLVARLGELGVTTLAQIAAWDDTEIDRIDGQLGRFAGRIRQDDWVGQAKLLRAGKADDFASRYGASG